MIFLLEVKISLCIIEVESQNLFTIPGYFAPPPPPRLSHVPPTLNNYAHWELFRSRKKGKEWVGVSYKAVTVYFPASHPPCALTFTIAKRNVAHRFFGKEPMKNKRYMTKYTQNEAVLVHSSSTLFFLIVFVFASPAC